MYTLKLYPWYIYYTRGKYNGKCDQEYLTNMTINVDILNTAEGSLYNLKSDMILDSWRVVEAPFSEVYTEPSTTATRHAITQHYFF